MKAICLNSLAAISFRQIADPVMCALVLPDFTATATATGMSTTLNAWIATMPRSDKAITLAVLIGVDLFSMTGVAIWIRALVWG